MNWPLSYALKVSVAVFFVLISLTVHVIVDRDPRGSSPVGSVCRRMPFQADALLRQGRPLSDDEHAYLRRTLHVAVDDLRPPLGKAAIAIIGVPPGSPVEEQFAQLVAGCEVQAQRI